MQNNAQTMLTNGVLFSRKYYNDKHKSKQVKRALGKQL